MAEEGALSQLKPALEIVGGAAALLAAIGYMSIRTRCRYLGIEAEGFSAETYLAEAYLFLTASAAIVALPITLILAFILALSAFGRIGPSGISLALSRLGGRQPISAILLLSGGVAALIYFAPDPANRGLLLRPLSGILETKRYFPFVGSLATSALLGWAASYTPFWQGLNEATKSSIADAARILVIFLCVSLLWCSIGNFNLNVRRVELWSAKITDKQGHSLACGFLAATTNDDNILWVPVGSSEGGLVAIRKSETRTLALGQRYNLDAAVMRLQAIPDCIDASSVAKPGNNITPWR